MQCTINLPEYTIYITAVQNKKAQPIAFTQKGPEWYQEFLKSLKEHGTIREAVKDMNNKGYPLKYSTARATHWRFSKQEA